MKLAHVKKHSLVNASLVYLRFDSILACKPARAVGFDHPE